MGVVVTLTSDECAGGHPAAYGRLSLMVIGAANHAPNIQGRGTLAQLLARTGEVGEAGGIGGLYSCRGCLRVSMGHEICSWVEGRARYLRFWYIVVQDLMKRSCKYILSNVGMH